MDLRDFPRERPAHGEPIDQLLPLCADQAHQIPGAVSGQGFGFVHDLFHAHQIERLIDEAGAFAIELVRGIVLHRTELDALLAEHATNWRISRMAAVDRNILRIGAYELVHSDTPVQIVLDEAIELARRYGNDPSPAFVNGVLDAIKKRG